MHEWAGSKCPLLSEFCPDTEESILVDEAMENELTSSKPGRKVVLKHLYQQVSWTSFSSLSPSIIFYPFVCLIRQLGSVTRAGDLNTEDPGSNHWLGLLNGFVPGDTRGKFTNLCK